MKKDMTSKDTTSIWWVVLAIIFYFLICYVCFRVGASKEKSKYQKAVTLTGSTIFQETPTPYYIVKTKGMTLTTTNIDEAIRCARSTHVGLYGLNDLLIIRYPGAETIYKKSSSFYDGRDIDKVIVPYQVRDLRLLEMAFPEKEDR
jgi:hypothetical protein